MSRLLFKAWKGNRLSFQNTNWTFLYFQVRAVTSQSILRDYALNIAIVQNVFEISFCYLQVTIFLKGRPSQQFLTYEADFFQQGPWDL